MTFKPPFNLTGEAGKAHEAVSYSLAALGVEDAVLSLRSLDADILQFTIRDNGNRPAIPEDGQWLTLTDDAGQRLFTGIVKRSFRFPERIYSYEVANVYRGLMETNLLSNGRPFITYFAADAAIILKDLLARAADVGLAVQSADMPPMFDVPKMSFRASSYAGALEDVLKWLPDVTTRMDYSTQPPTLRFFRRASAAGATLDLSGTQKITERELTPYPEIRALAVDFSYAKRLGERTVEVLSQTAGDPAAAGMRKISLFISGAERMDAFIAEALITAMDAKKMALSLGAANTSTAKSLVIDWDFIKVYETHIAQAVAAQSDFLMYLGTPVFNLTNGNSVGFGSGTDTFSSVKSTSGIRPATLSLTAGGAAAPGWYPITLAAAAEWDTAELAAVGVQKQVGYYSNDLFWDSRYWANNMVSAALNVLDNFPAQYKNASWNYGSIRTAWFRLDPIPVWVVDAPPSTIDALLSANNSSFDLDFIGRAEYVDIPNDLAANYFEGQNWTPYKGRIAIAPNASDLPAPGDFINVFGDGTPSEWTSMKVPISELSMDLRSQAATVTIGPSPRMDFSSLIDRLRIPPEDNFQPG